MTSEDKIKNKLGKDSGFRVPDGYFEQKFIEISSRLPERETLPPEKLSSWQRFKPYIYLVAMFAGIWCTLKMVSMIGERSSQIDAPVSLDNPPALVAEAMSTPEVVDFAVPAATATEADIVAAAQAVTEPVSEDSAPQDEAVDDAGIPMDYYDIDLSQLRAELKTDEDAVDESSL